MAIATVPVDVYKGGYWLLKDTNPDLVFTPEKLTDEHKLMNRTAREFVANEVMPQLEHLEAKEWDVARRLVKRCGELGFLGADAPEEYGGLDLDKVSSAVIAEGIGPAPSFSVTFGAMTSLAIMPLVMFGTDEQKKKYLTHLVSGDMVGAYGLSESNSGSDALGARARASVEPDGSFLLNGEKMWLSNCNFADLFVVFAKVNGDQFTAFLVERKWPGVSTGREEHKLGLHGSSTAPLILQDVRVPKENVLGEVGKGHKVAFDVLNYGRFKLGVKCLGGAKAVIGEAATYAGTRHQFGRPIATFGAIKHKIGEMTARTYGLESVIYRLAGLLDAAKAASATGGGSAVREALDQFSVECSITKVMASEVLHYCIDENVQIHGGNGFVRDYPAERYYRDARVNRIFEGTNEINRLLIPGMLMRKALKDELPLIPAAMKLYDEIMTPGLSEAPGDGLLEAESAAVTAFKKVGLLVTGAAMQRFGKHVNDEQEVLGAVADICIDTFTAESALLRALDASTRALPNAARHADVVRVMVSDAAARIETSAKMALAAMADGDMLRTQLAALRRVLKVTPINTVAVRRALAEETVAKRSYIF
ncbi:MAG: fadE [Acidobacteria bacterium]|jgi:alkylation response protein AidB-like acyl-CoA dehydrogenase|nr:fadE [Acidobacteriota bacterium]